MWTSYFENPTKGKVYAEKEENQMTLIKGFLWYAEKELECEFPEEFAEKLYKISFDSRIPKKETIDCIIKDWLIWKPYVSEDDFNVFVQKQIESLFEKHSVATFSSPTLRGYIGNKVKVIKPLPHPLSTAISFNGLFSKNGTKMQVL